MDHRYFLTAAEMCELECILDKTEGVGFGGDFEWFHDTWVHFMLDTSKLSFSVFSDNCDVDIGVTGLDTRVREAEWDIGEEVEMFVELVIIVIFGFDSFFRHHDSQQYTLIFLQSIPLFQILKSKITDALKINWNIGRIEYLNHTTYGW